MAYKVSNITIRARNGGFIVGVDLENANIDANLNDNKYDEYVVPTYAKLMKALKEELKDFAPVRKPRVKMSGVA
jgi:hypothetical protein